MRSLPILALLVVPVAACGGAGHPPATVAKQAPPAIPPGPVLPAACQHNATVDEGGNLVVEGRWRDQPVKVLVDTGANSGSISNLLVSRYQLPVIGNAKYASASGQFVDTTMHDAGELEVGGVTVMAHSMFGHAAHATRYDFVIGLDQLEPHAMVVDLPRGAFCLIESPQALATEPMRIGGSGAYREILVSAAFGAVHLDDMILDTGAGVTTVNDAHLASLEHTVQPDKVSAVDGTGNMVELSLVTVPRMCVGAACSSDHTVMPTADLSPVVQHHVDGIVGLPFFLEHVLVVDFPAGKLGIL